METRQYSTFGVGNLFFGVEVVHVQEVIRYQNVTRVPLAASVVEGLINLRGQIVTAFEMRRVLSLPERAGEQLPMNVVLTSDHGGVSLLVDEIGDVVEVDEERFEVSPDTVAPEVSRLLLGVYKLEERLLLVLDPREVTAYVRPHVRNT